MKVYFDGQIFIEQVVGGISRYYANLVNALNTEQGVNAKIIAPFHRNEHLVEFRNGAAFGMRFPAHWRVGRISWAMLRVASPMVSMVARPDIVHETYYARAPYLGNARRRVTTVYDMIHELYFPGSETAEMKKKTLARCDHVFCISRNTQKDLCEIYNFPLERTSVTHLSYRDFGNFRGCELPEQLEGAPFFLFVGNRGGYKNFKIVLAAYAAEMFLRKNFRIIAIGGGSFTAEEEAICRELNLTSKQVIQISGNDELLGLAYAHATAFIYPSLYEGFGIPPLEAMSVDCPVISSNTSSLPEVVGRAALTFNPLDVEQLSVAMTRVAETEDLRADLSILGKQRCRMFSWQRCARDTLAAYELIS